jgi:predicted outer membrane repeat protein
MFQLCRRPAPSLLALALLLASAATARTYTIGTFIDDAIPNLNCTLREAIRAASSDTPVDECPAGEADDTIVLPGGTYYFSSAEDIFVDTKLTIRSASGDPTSATVDLGGANRFLNCFGSDSGAGLLTLSGITMQNGVSLTQGGAVSTIRFGLVLDHVRFVGNHADEGGGAVYFHSGGTAAPLVVTFTSFEGNSAYHLGGAVIAVTNSGAAARLEDTEFVNNSASAGGAGFTSAGGGGLELQALEDGSASLRRCRFVGNSVATTFSSSSFDDALGGGARLTAADGAIVMSDTTFLENGSNVDSGAMDQTPAFAVLAYNHGVVDVDRVLVDGSTCTSCDNAADVRLLADTGADVAVTNSQVTDGDGFGVLADTDDASIALGYLTVAGYTFGTGAYLDTGDGGTVQLFGSLLANNSTDVLGIGVGVHQTDNCAAMSGDFPGFVDTAGGNFHLRATSAAVDAGTTAPARPFDLDHAPRRVGVRTDCGAYELGGLFANGFEGGDTSEFSAALSG